VTQRRERTMKRMGTARGVRIGAVAAAVSAIGLAVALPASGHKVAYDTNLNKVRFDTLNDTTERYSGKVMSPKPKCEAGRTITVTQSGVAVGTTVSNSEGEWVLTGPVPPKGAQLTVSTPKKILKKNKKHRHKCKAASRSAKFEGQGPPHPPHPPHQ
jgi:hypothetical protein